MITLSLPVMGAIALASLIAVGLALAASRLYALIRTNNAYKTQLDQQDDQLSALVRQQEILTQQVERRGRYLVGFRQTSKGHTALIVANTPEQWCERVEFELFLPDSSVHPLLSCLATVEGASVHHGSPSLDVTHFRVDEAYSHRGLGTLGAQVLAWFAEEVGLDTITSTTCVFAQPYQQSQLLNFCRAQGCQVSLLNNQLRLTKHLLRPAAPPADAPLEARRVDDPECFVGPPISPEWLPATKC